MIGIDLVEVERIKKFVNNKTDEQLTRLFTPTEIQYANSSLNREQRFAVRFAVKEAFFKVFNFGLFHEIELDRHGKAPFITLYGETLKKWEEMGKPMISVSVSHTQHHAIAVVMKSH